MKLIKAAKSIIAKIKGKSYVLPINHPNAEKIEKLAEKANQYPESIKQQILNAIEDRAECLADIKMYLKKHTSNLFNVDQDNNVYINGEKLPHCLGGRLVEYSEVTNTLVKARALLKFWEKCKANPDPRAQSDLFLFLDHNGFPITDDGNFIGYKGVYFNGEKYLDNQTKSIDQSPGLTVEMPRSECNPDPEKTCSNGLHIATLDYARGIGNRILSVEVDPTDVVAIPTDYNRQKMRTCKFKSLEDLTKYTDKHKVKEFDNLFMIDDEDDRYFYDEYCEGCDELIDNCDCVSDIDEEDDECDDEQEDISYLGIIINNPVKKDIADYQDNDPTKTFTVII